MRRKALAAAAIVAIWTGPAAAQTIPQAETFVRRLYAAYEKGEPDYLHKGARRTFSPALLALIRKEHRDAAAAGEAGRLDWDPICGCQDSEGLKLTALEITETGAGKARAKVGIGARNATLLLTSSRGRWRVDDVWTPDTPSLKDLLSVPAP